MSFIRSLECAAFLGITSRIERDIASTIHAAGKTPTQYNWNVVRELQKELSSIQKLIIEYNSLTETIATKERNSSHMAFLYPEESLNTSSNSLAQKQVRLKEVSSKLSEIYRREMSFTQVDLSFQLTKMNAHIWALEQSYPQPSQDTIDIIEQFKQKRQLMKDELQFVNQKLNKD